jgi:hypothetical protein
MKTARFPEYLSALSIAEFLKEIEGYVKHYEAVLALQRLNEKEVAAKLHVKVQERVW